MALYQQAKAKLISDKQLRAEIADRLSGAGSLIPGPKLTKTTASRPAPAPTPTPRTLSGGFTVQTGVYSTLKRAKAEARRFQTKGPTRTLQITNRAGAILWAVQVGRFASKQDADRVRKLVGNGAIVAEVLD
jgi:cell division protein FtsN